MSGMRHLNGNISLKIESISNLLHDTQTKWAGGGFRRPLLSCFLFTIRFTDYGKAELHNTCITKVLCITSPPSHTMFTKQLREIGISQARKANCDVPVALLNFEVKSFIVKLPLTWITTHMKADSVETIINRRHAILLDCRSRTQPVFAYQEAEDFKWVRSSLIFCSNGVCVRTWVYYQNCF